MYFWGKTFRKEEKEKKKTELEKDINLIGRLYRESANKANEIRILSQLYQKSESTIVGFLYKNGFNDATIRRWLNIK